VLTSGELMVFPPLNLKQYSRRELFTALRAVEARHTIVAPIKARHGTLGALVMHATEERGFGVQEIGTVVEIATRLGLAIENARLYADAQAANNAKTEFLATISHELRTPLTAVIGYTELLMSGLAEPLPSTANNWLQRIRASAEHQVRLIEDILTYVRAEADRAGVRVAPVQTRELVEQAVSVLRPSFDQSAVELIIDAPVSVELQTDADRVRQILINLLTNALKFTPHGTVTLTVAIAEAGVRFTVTDTGIGIEKQHLEKVFQAFWQVEQSDTRRFAGSGLGLAVSRRLARQLGGDLFVASEVGQGSSFTLELPVQRPAARTLEEAEPDPEG
jgi:signal transduction histidine kinase